jgi:hypothetical protein
MKRIRWFRLSLRTELLAFARQLASKVFLLDEAVSSGFRIEKGDKSEIIGQFIHKKTFDQTVVLPSGEKFTQEVAAIEVTRFGVVTSPTGLLLYTSDAPRSITPFLSALSEVTKFGCVVEPLEIDISRWIDQVSFASGGVFATYLDVTGIKVSDSVQGRLALSGDSDVYGSLKEFLGPNVSGVIDSARIRLDFDGEYYMVELGRRAAVKVPAGFPSSALDAMREAMLHSIIEGAN